MPLPSKFETFFQELSPVFRKNLRRYERKILKNFRVNFRVCNGFDKIEKIMSAFFDLHQKRWQSKQQSGAFSDQTFRSFHLEVARRFNEKGWLVLNVLSLNDVIGAVKYSFIYENKLYSYLSSFDPELQKYSLGNLLHLYTIQDCIASGLQEYDLMRGNELYKLKWNTRMRRNMEFWISRRRPIPMLYDVLTKNERLSAIARQVGKHISLE